MAQARQSLENVKAIIEQAGLTVGDIVKTTVFVKDLNDFATVNAEYENCLLYTSGMQHFNHRATHDTRNPCNISDS